MPNLTEDEKQKIKLGANNFVKRLNLGKIAIWLITLIPVFELIYLYRAAH